MTDVIRGQGFSLYRRAQVIMKELSINRCFGAHLALTEATAAAGVALEAPLHIRNTRPRTDT